MRLIDADEAMALISEKKYARKILAEQILYEKCKEVKAIPIEWIKEWCNTQSGKSLEERLLKRYGVLTLLEDWEKENGNQS